MRPGRLNPSPNTLNPSPDPNPCPGAAAGMAIESAAAVTMQKMERARQGRSRLKAHSSRLRSGSGLGEDGEVLSALEISEIELGSSGRSRSSSGESLGASLMRQRPLRSRLQAEAKPQAKVVYSVTQLIAKAMFDRHSGGDGNPNPTPNPNPKPNPSPNPSPQP